MLIAARFTGRRHAAGLRAPGHRMGLAPRPVIVAGAPAAVAFTAQPCYFFLEVGERLESPVHRGKPQVGDLVEVAKRAQDRETHFVRRNFPAAAAADRVLHPLGEDRELILADRPALAGTLHAPDDLVPVERLGHAAALRHHENDRLLGGEAAATGWAGPPAADRGPVFGGPAVDDPAVRVPTIRTVHAIHLPSGAPAVPAP